MESPFDHPKRQFSNDCMEEDNAEDEHPAKKHCSAREIYELMDSFEIWHTQHLAEQAQGNSYQFELPNIHAQGNGYVDAEVVGKTAELVLDPGEYSSPISIHSEQSMVKREDDDSVYSHMASLDTWHIPEYLRNSSADVHKLRAAEETIYTISGVDPPSVSGYFDNAQTSSEVQALYIQEQQLQATAQEEVHDPVYRIEIIPGTTSNQEETQPIPFHSHINFPGRRFKNLRCLLRPMHNGNHRCGGQPEACLNDCQLQNVNESDYKAYNMFEIELLRHAELPTIIRDICYNQLSPYALLEYFGIAYLFQPYLQVLTWSELDELFCGNALNSMINNFVDTFNEPMEEFH